MDKLHELIESSKRDADNLFGKYKSKYYSLLYLYENDDMVNEVDYIEKLIFECIDKYLSDNEKNKKDLQDRINELKTN